METISLAGAVSRRPVVGGSSRAAGKGGRFTVRRFNDFIMKEWGLNLLYMCVTNTHVHVTIGEVRRQRARLRLIYVQLVHGHTDGCHYICAGCKNDNCQSETRSETCSVLFAALRREKMKSTMSIDVCLRVRERQTVQPVSFSLSEADVWSQLFAVASRRCHRHQVWMTWTDDGAGRTVQKVKMLRYQAWIRHPLNGMCTIAVTTWTAASAISFWAKKQVPHIECFIFISPV